MQPDCQCVAELIVAIEHNSAGCTVVVFLWSRKLPHHKCKSEMYISVYIECNRYGFLNDLLQLFPVLSETDWMQLPTWPNSIADRY